MSAKENQPPATKAGAILFNPREIGESLRKVASDLLRVEEREVETHWYHSKKDADLFFWKDHDRRIIKQQVSYFGQVVEWNMAEGIKTGLAIEEEGERGIKGSSLVRYDAEPQRHAVDQGAQIIEHVEGLAPVDRDTLVFNLTGQRLPTHFHAGGEAGWFVRVLQSLGLFRK
jgi:hypothetical protein